MESRVNIAIVAKVKQGDLFAALRKRDWSVARASRELGIKASVLYDLMNMRRIPTLSLEDEVKLAELTGKTLEEMLPKEFDAKAFLDGRRELVAFRDCDPRTLTAAGFRALPIPLGAIDQERLVLAEHFLKRLTSRERRVIELTFMESLDFAEAATEMEVSHQRIEQIRNRALKKLREMSHDQRLIDRLIPK